MKWQNEPVSWSEVDGAVTMECAEGTDFWLKTHYGFVHENSHFYFEQAPGDFTASASFEAQYRNQYDQAGIMIWLDPNNWLKAGVEFLDGRQVLSVVVTHEFSDWSMDSADVTGAVTVRLTRQGDTVTVEFEVDGSTRMARLAYMDPALPARVGPMACAPSGSGFIPTLSGCKLFQSIEGKP